MGAREGGKIPDYLKSMTLEIGNESLRGRRAGLANLEMARIVKKQRRLGLQLDNSVYPKSDTLGIKLILPNLKERHHRFIVPVKYTTKAELPKRQKVTL